MKVRLFYFPTHNRPRPSSHYYCLMTLEEKENIVEKISATILKQGKVEIGKVDTIEELCRALNVSIDLEGHRYRYKKQWLIIRNDGIVCKMAPKVDMDKPRLHGTFIFDESDEIFDYI